MDSHQSIVLPLKNSSVVFTESEKQKSDFPIQSSGSVSGELRVVHRKEESVAEKSGGIIGVLEVYIHQARDIHNICIYHKQDVYAKLCLTSNPESTFSTQIINGGGKNPVFNENFRLNVQTLDSSLKCEIWMLSRVKNYLEDQLLGFALVPLSEIFIGNGRLAQEFSLSSTDLFHSPAGFVQLSISYSGSSPEVMAIPTPRASLTANTALQDSEISDSLPNEYDKIEFPDPKILNENHFMVSQYIGMPCATLDSQSSESLATSDTDKNHLSSSVGVLAVESFSEASLDSFEPASSVSTNGSPSASNPDQDLVLPSKEKNSDVVKDESDSSVGVPSRTFAQSAISVNMVPEQTVVQQDIVDIYMKSMQQFTESLAKMKLPMDIENDTTNSNSGNTNLSSDQKLQASKASGSRVFYGSRAFF